MAVTYIEVKGGGTTSDLEVTADNMVLSFAMSSYQSGVHGIKRTSTDGTKPVEQVVLYADPDYDTTVTVYLLDDPVFGYKTETYMEQVVKTDAKGQLYTIEEPRQRTYYTMTENEGTFIVDLCRQGLDTPYAPDKHLLVMRIGSFVIPKGFTGSLADLNISFLKVV